MSSSTSIESEEEPKPKPTIAAKEPEKRPEEKESEKEPETKTGEKEPEQKPGEKQQEKKPGEKEQEKKPSEKQPEKKPDKGKGPEKESEKKAEPEVEKKPPVPLNLDSVLTYTEEIPVGEERELANNLDRAFGPCRQFMIALFRFPLLLLVQPDYSRRFTYSWKSFRGWMFFVTGSFMFINAGLIVINLGGVLLNAPAQPDHYTSVWHEAENEADRPQDKDQRELRIEELFLIQRNYVPIVMALLSLCHVCTGDVSLFFKRKFVAHYFSFWDDAVELMKIDAALYPEDVRKFMRNVTSFYCGFLVIFLGLCAMKFAPLASGGPAQLVILWCRIFYPQIHATSFFGYLIYAGDIVFAYIVMCSKVYVLLFLYKCKIMKNAFAIWNERLEKVLHKGEQGATREEQCKTRTGYDHLFRDYVTLLSLLRGSDTLFTNTIESYYGTQTFSICFEVFYLIRSVGAHEEFKKARRLDAILMGVYLFHSLVMLFLASTASASVGDTAMNGLEIIRRKGCIGRKTNDEMFFTLSLYMSYTGHFETAFSAGQYVVFDRGFLVAFVGSIFTYFIILNQFTPPLAMLDPRKLRIIKSTRDLILHAENTNTKKLRLPSKFEVGY